MKIGVRTPNIKRSLKARTTGRVKRAAKKAVNPMYGQKGMGAIKNPERAAKDAVYRRATVGVGDIVSGSSKSNSGVPSNAGIPETVEISQEQAFNISNGMCIALIIVGILLLFVFPLLGVIGIVGGIISLIYGRARQKRLRSEATDRTT